MNTTTTATTQTVVYAPNMLAAQGYQMSDEVRATLTAKADRFRQITGTTEPTSMVVQVRDARFPDCTIGHLTYML